jgi:hypothetical protein
MKSQEFMQLLDSLYACSEAKEWAQGKSFHVFWTTCKRGDWLLWLCGTMAGKKGWPTRKQIVLAACGCAETAPKYVKADEDRPRIAIKTARQWARGKATLQQVRDAAAASDAAYASYVGNAVYYAAYAAYYPAAAYASYVGNAVYSAAFAAAAAVYSAAFAAAAAAAAYYPAYAAYSAAAARTKVLADCAKIVRRELKEPRP